MDMINQEVEILLVEDNMGDAELTMRALKKNNMFNKLVHLQDGAEAIDFIFGQGSYTGRKVEHGPKIILMDIKMPKVDGLQVLQKVKSDDRTKKIPVVMLTSSKENPDIDTSYSLGANSYVVKPVDFESFVKTVRDLGMYWMLINQTV